MDDVLAQHAATEKKRRARQRPANAVPTSAPAPEGQMQRQTPPQNVDPRSVDAARAARAPEQGVGGQGGPRPQGEALRPPQNQQGRPSQGQQRPQGQGQQRPQGAQMPQGQRPQGQQIPQGAQVPQGQRPQGQPPRPPQGAQPYPGQPPTPSGATLGRIQPVKVPASQAKFAPGSPQQPVPLYTDPEPQQPQGPVVSTPRRGFQPKRDAPERPALVNPSAAPVMAKAPPPFTVRMAQFLWVLSFAVGAVAIVFYFVIREDQLPLIQDVIRGVSEGREDGVYESAADILFWSVFGIMVTLLLFQVAQLVSFSGRKPNIRWWQLGTTLVMVVVYLIALEFVGTGEYGAMLEQLFIAQAGLAVLALLFSTFPNALRWTARRVDVRPAGGADDF